MSKTILAAAIQDAAQLTNQAATRAAGASIDAIVTELKASGRFTLPGFGTLTVHALPARDGRNPGNGAVVAIAASSTVRFKPAPALREALTEAAKPPAKRAAVKAKAKPVQQPAKAPLRRKAAAPGNSANA
jgi:DNA-binding protein HU-beta